ncbi:hypothetical protein Bbelb_221150 [Branchiostoma belcheri]|nr:hypothetical protein Bbelb_221150 [Branchiostoma belcheri]
MDGRDVPPPLPRKTSRRPGKGDNVKIQVEEESDRKGDKEKQEVVEKDEDSERDYEDLDPDGYSIFALGSGLQRAAPNEPPPRHLSMGDKEKKEVEERDDESDRDYEDLDPDGYGVFALGSGLQRPAPSEPPDRSGAIRVVKEKEASIEMEMRDAVSSSKQQCYEDVDAKDVPPPLPKKTSRLLDKRDKENIQVEKESDRKYEDGYSIFALGSGLQRAKPKEPPPRHLNMGDKEKKEVEERDEDSDRDYEDLDPDGYPIFALGAGLQRAAPNELPHRHLGMGDKEKKEVLEKDEDTDRDYEDLDPDGYPIFALGSGLQRAAPNEPPPRHIETQEVVEKDEDSDIEYEDMNPDRYGVFPLGSGLQRAAPNEPPPRHLSMGDKEKKEMVKEDEDSDIDYEDLDPDGYPIFALGAGLQRAAPNEPPPRHIETQEVVEKDEDSDIEYEDLDPDGYPIFALGAGLQRAAPNEPPPRHLSMGDKEKKEMVKEDEDSDIDYEDLDPDGYPIFALGAGLQRAAPNEPPHRHLSMGDKEKNEMVKEDEDSDIDYEDLDPDGYSIFALGSGLQRAAPNELPPRHLSMGDIEKKEMVKEDEDSDIDYEDLDPDGYPIFALGAGLQRAAPNEPPPRHIETQEVVEKDEDSDIEYEDMNPDGYGVFPLGSGLQRAKPNEPPPRHLSMGDKEKQEVVERDGNSDIDYEDLDPDGYPIFALGSGLQRAAPNEPPPRHLSMGDKKKKEMVKEDEDSDIDYEDLDPDGYPIFALGAGLQRAAPNELPHLHLSMGDKKKKEVVEKDEDSDIDYEDMNPDEPHPHHIEDNDEKQVGERNEETETRKYEDVDPAGYSIFKETCSDTNCKSEGRAGHRPGVPDATPSHKLDMGDHTVMWPEQNDDPYSDPYYKPQEIETDDKQEEGSLSLKGTPGLKMLQ